MKFLRLSDGQYRERILAAKWQVNNRWYPAKEKSKSDQTDEIKGDGTWQHWHYPMKF